MKSIDITSNPLEPNRKTLSEKAISNLKISRKPIKKPFFSLIEIRVFLVDDDVLFLKALENIITSKQPFIKIKTFQSGEACLDEMKQKPHIVVLDYYLNSSDALALNGLDVLKRIRKISPKTKVIMLSAQDSLQVAQNCIDNNAYDYLSKSESSFVRINNILTYIVEELKLNYGIIRPFQILTIIIILMIAINFIFNL